ncbi:hypothetical protein FB451DRAFT_159201 [Mycena latifolia]|nr:hypothetical protein FB451DRAFT_159201 [Mycena latifolia]
MHSTVYARRPPGPQRIRQLLHKYIDIGQSPLYYQLRLPSRALDLPLLPCMADYQHRVRGRLKDPEALLGRLRSRIVGQVGACREVIELTQQGRDSSEVRRRRWAPLTWIGRTQRTRDESARREQDARLSLRKRKTREIFGTQKRGGREANSEGPRTGYGGASSTIGARRRGGVAGRMRATVGANGCDAVG